MDFLPRSASAPLVAAALIFLSAPASRADEPAATTDSDSIATEPAASFFAEDVVDKLLLFLAPTVSGAGPRVLGDFTGPIALSRLAARRVGEDVLLSAYVHEP